MERKVKTIIITHRDKFIRFGYDWFESFCEKFDTSILVVNNEESSPQEELVEDIVSILHMFSCRLYGLRKYKKLIKEDEEETMKQYCRYCAGLVTGNGIYCTFLNKERSEASTKVVNYCKHFEFCEMDAYDMEHIYKPKIQKLRESPDEQIEGQMSIFDLYKS